MILDKLNLAVGAAAGGVLVFMAATTVNSLILLPEARNEGRELERAAALQKSIKLIRERGNINAEVGKLSDNLLCAELGGKWVLDHCE